MGGAAAHPGAAEAGAADPGMADAGAADPGTAGPGAGHGPAGRGEPDLSPADLAAMLRATRPTPPPQDPVLAPLLPDASRDDPEAAGAARPVHQHDPPS